MSRPINGKCPITLRLNFGTCPLPYGDYRKIKVHIIMLLTKCICPSFWVSGRSPQKLICLSGVKTVMGRVNKNNQHKLVKDVFVNNCYHLKHSKVTR